MRLEPHRIELRRWAVWQWRRTMASADAAGCRVYEEKSLHAMSIYGKIAGNHDSPAVTHFGSDDRSPRGARDRPQRSGRVPTTDFAACHERV
jgi:hypothetical protein